MYKQKIQSFVMMLKMTQPVPRNNGVTGCAKSDTLWRYYPDKSRQRQIYYKAVSY